MALGAHAVVSSRSHSWHAQKVVGISYDKALSTVRGCCERRAVKRALVLLRRGGRLRSERVTARVSRTPAAQRRASQCCLVRRALRLGQLAKWALRTRDLTRRTTPSQRVYHRNQRRLGQGGHDCPGQDPRPRGHVFTKNFEVPFLLSESHQASGLTAATSSPCRVRWNGGWRRHAFPCIFLSRVGHLRAP